MQLPVVSMVTEMGIELVCRAAERLLESLRRRREKSGRRRLAGRTSGAGQVPAVVVVLVLVDGPAQGWGVSR